jgi:2-polyprenyl-6-methoxyphenol hydroxylase-like FAD-dependent oxidoreductase
MIPGVCQSSKSKKRKRNMSASTLPVLIAGAGPVGCFVAYRLGKAGIQVQILEREPSLPYSPRAVGYYGATQVAFQEAGIYDLVRSEGFVTAGLCWRQPPVTNDHGGKSLGKMIAKQPLCAPGDTIRACPSGLLNLRQSELTKLLLREALNTGNVTVHFNSEVTGIEQEHDKVHITFNNPDLQSVTGSYLVGADGGKSRVRRIIETPCLGHTWPERIISTDVYLLNTEDPIYHTSYIMDLKNYTLMTPLATPTIGERSLWRVTVAIPPEDQRSDEELTQEETIQGFYEQVVAGPRPLNAEISAKTVYRIHQRLVTTMRKGRCVLAGDAAHLNNVSSV